MDPFLLAAAGSAVLAVALKKKKVVTEVPVETYCPPAPPPITSPEWIAIAKQATNLIGGGGALAATAFIPGFGLVVAGGISLGQQAVNIGLDMFDQATTGQKQEIRQNLINICYGKPPGTIFPRFGASKRISMTYTLVDLYFVLSNGVLKSGIPGMWTRAQLLAERPVSIGVGSEVKYFVTAEGPPRCCAKRISPAQAQANGHKLYSEADARAFWQKVKSRGELRRLQDRLAVQSAFSVAKSDTKGTEGSGFLKSGGQEIAVVRDVPYNRAGQRYVPAGKDIAPVVMMCHPALGHMTLFCDPSLGSSECVWVTANIACLKGSEAAQAYGPEWVRMNACRALKAYRQGSIQLPPAAVSQLQAVCES